MSLVLSQELMPISPSKDCGELLCLNRVLGQRIKAELSCCWESCPCQRETQTLCEFLAVDVEPQEVQEQTSGPITRKARLHPD